MTGWIKLHRRLLEWEWYQDSNTFRVFLHLLLTARYEDGHSLGVPVSRGQVITGRRKLAGELGLSEKEIRTALDKLERTGEIVKKTANKFSIITICNYIEYQHEEIVDGPAKGQQRASKGPLIKKERSKEEIYTASGDALEVGVPVYRSKKGKLLKGRVLIDFEKFWNAFAYRKGKAEAADAFLVSYRPDIVEEIIAGAKREAQGRPALIAKNRTPIWAQGWLSNRRWEDEDSAGTVSGSCNLCRYNHNEPCPNLSKLGFNPARCDSYQRIEVRA